MAGYLPLLILLVLAIGFVAVSFLGSGLLGPSRPTAAKSADYESGIVPSHRSPQRFPVRFYLVAMIFIIFDIEIIFTYPWAVIYTHDLGRYGLVEMVVFAVVVFVSFLYLVANGALDWGPIKRVVRPLADPGPTRTASSTVRRVTKPAAEPTAEPGLIGVGAAGEPDKVA